MDAYRFIYFYLFGLVSGFPVAFFLVGVSLLFAGVGWLFNIFDISLIYVISQRVFSAMTNEIFLSVPLFVFMGDYFRETGDCIRATR